MDRDSDTTMKFLDQYRDDLDPKTEIAEPQTRRGVDLLQRFTIEAWKASGADHPLLEKGE